MVSIIALSYSTTDSKANDSETIRPYPHKTLT